MIVFTYIILIVTAYILGSIPSAVWAGRFFHGVDVREHGSGNAGTTNVIRVLGWKTGIPVLIIDMIKGWAATMLPALFNIAEPESTNIIVFQIIAGLAAITGHIFPVFAGFRGGKGVATMFGVLIGIHPLLTIACFGVFLVVFAATGIVSVSSMSAGIAFPILLLSVFHTPSLALKVFSVIIGIALIITHRKNIGRLIRGEEKKLFRKKSQDPDNK
ncbi:MAG TPA: glycerol-3-phosphate 1-O-acyltransferase PlsY [Bacteroidales bacterium]|nr:glycerol-3-phosphate 1-O-acyltransferase PlsY [Bacteroidales bacterium]HPI69143.1 glycerol-3-phosphate 1-O-acyltransferase PlsY [Bacteroidales bacterium]HPR73139.1 glycerol-3-phosphate 1-O-acyltransferase PlsY [Bacteroidales bacterium]